MSKSVFVNTSFGTVNVENVVYIRDTGGGDVNKIVLNVNGQGLSYIGNREDIQKIQAAWSASTLRGARVYLHLPYLLVARKYIALVSKQLLLTTGEQLAFEPTLQWTAEQWAQSVQEQLITES